MITCFIRYEIDPFKTDEDRIFLQLASAPHARLTP